MPQLQAAEEFMSPADDLTLSPSYGAITWAEPQETKFDALWTELHQDQLASLAHVSSWKIEFLEHFYHFRNPEQVYSFIERRPFLIPVLLDAYCHVQRYFGKDMSVAVEVFADPESADEQVLFALIVTDLPPEVAMNRLSLLDEEWWLEASSQTKGEMNIHLEFV